MNDQYYMLSEIKETPDIIKNIFESNIEPIKEIASKIRNYNPRFSMLVGRGSSDNACVYGQYVFEYLVKISSFLSTGSLYLFYKNPPIYTNGLIIGISQSGETDDVLKISEYAKKMNNFVVGITNVENSSLHEITTENTIFLSAGEEKSVCATKSFTTSLLAVLLLASFLSDSKISLDDILPPLEYIVSREAEIRKLAEVYTFAPNVIVLGTGFSYSTALETALKLRESCYVKSIGASTIDFLHGPIAMLSDNVPVIVFAPDDETVSLTLDALEAIRETGAHILVVSDNQGLCKFGDLCFELPKTANFLYPFAEALFAQLFSFYLSISKRLDPDKPRYLRKVTRI
ncbi:SIS domain-containing protein [Caldisericum sp.]|jgi:glucosamine--fructose-6-phosphate aminotransferase (isomerizing)|uniref:SIS domain-containing protein n=1 Tax=Caldisericum sp. TaxID=2499687 RepID=UPI003D09C1AD